MSKRLKTNNLRCYTYCANHGWNEHRCHCHESNIEVFTEEEVKEKFNRSKMDRFKLVSEHHKDSYDLCHYQESELLYWRREYCKATNPFLWKRIQAEKDALNTYELIDARDFERVLMYNEGLSNTGYCLAVLTFILNLVDQRVWGVEPMTKFNKGVSECEILCR